VSNYFFLYQSTVQLQNAVNSWAIDSVR
jgi:hypothetical protein